MKNILVVDDEPIIAKGVSTLINTFNLPDTSTRIVLDSEEALKICQEQKIDIVITDINMPKLNGIELIKQIKSININIQVIILTGFGSFSYAKEAMTLGVKYFLEKPISSQNLYDAVTNSIASSDRKQIESSLLIKRGIEQFLDSSSEQKLPECLTFPFCLYIFDSKFYSKVSNLIEIYPNKNQLIVGHQNKTGYIIVQKKNGEFNSFIREKIKEIHIGKGIMIDFTVKNTESFLQKFQLGKRNLDKDFYFDELEVIHESQIMSEKQYENKLYTTFQQQLLEFLSQGELTQGQTTTKAFFNSCREQLYPVQLLRLQTIDLLTTIFDGFLFKKDCFFDDYSPKIMLLNDWKELQFMVFHCIDLLRDNATNADNMKLYQKVNIIIEEYYENQELSLKWIATKQLFLNSEYLGKTYFKETGIRFNQKLAEYRIQKAKELLIQNFKVYEVADLTGFGKSPEYFVQTFKKMTGMTPKQFLKTNAQVLSNQ